jgi:hypothetical protein
MKGHIYRRIRPDGNRSRWYAVIDLPPSPTGARRQQTTTHDTRREAQAWLAQRVQELRAGETYDTKLTTGEFLTSWLAGNRALRAATRAEYARHIDRHLVPAWATYGYTICALTTSRRCSPRSLSRTQPGRGRSARPRCAGSTPP